MMRVHTLRVIMPFMLFASLVSAAFGQNVRVQIVSLTSPVSPGSQASLIVKTNPGAVCTPIVSGPAHAKLESKQADAQGLARWRSRVPNQAATGTYQLTVTCAMQDSEASAHRSIVVR